jgi:hypothetical protein
MKEGLTMTKLDLNWKATEEAKRQFFQQSDAFVEQVTEFARDRANFWSAA